MNFKISDTFPKSIFRKTLIGLILKALPQSPLSLPAAGRVFHKYHKINYCMGLGAWSKFPQPLYLYTPIPHFSFLHHLPHLHHLFILQPHE